ncbi:MAG: hypothetical protein ACTHU0_12275 [Kofleriaceae bacterium]
MTGVLGIAALCAAPTSCEHFDDIVIPAIDTTPPTVINGVQKPGEANDGYTINGYYDEQLTDPNLSVIALATGIDSGGVRRLSVSWTIDRTCTNGSVSVLVAPLVATETETQPGAVGSTVSNGIWLARSFRASQYGCPSGTWPTWVGLSWTTEAEDFAGGITRHSARVFWRRP